MVEQKWFYWPYTEYISDGYKRDALCKKAIINKLVGVVSSIYLIRKFDFATIFWIPDKRLQHQ